jgi:hypothetical protein
VYALGRNQLEAVDDEAGVLVKVGWLEFLDETNELNG